MPVILAIIGLGILVSAIRNTQSELFTLVGQDAPGFMPWLGAIILIGMVGYVKGFEGASRALLLLVVLAIVLANQGAFANLAAAIEHPPAAAPAPAPGPPLVGPAPLQIQGGSSASGSSSFSGIAGSLVGPLSGAIL